MTMTSTSLKESLELKKKKNEEGRGQALEEH